VFCAAQVSIGQLFNFCTGERVEVRALADKMRAITGFRGQIQWDTIPRRPLDIQVLYGDATKAKSVLGWTAKVSLEEGLRRNYRFSGERNLQVPSELHGQAQPNARNGPASAHSRIHSFEVFRANLN